MSTIHTATSNAETADVVWDAARIRALGAVTDLMTAARIFDLSRTAAYDLAARNKFPVPVIRAGHRYRIPVAPILAILHIPDQPQRLDRAPESSVDHHDDQSQGPHPGRPPRPESTRP
jgi:hypothetical protein